MDEVTDYLNSIVKTNLRTLVNNHKVGENQKHYICTCPECMEKLDYNKPKLYVTKDYKIGFCQRCKSKFFHNVELGSNIDELVTPTFNFTREDNFQLDKVDCSYYEQSDELTENNLQYLNYRYSQEAFNKEIYKLVQKYNRRFDINYTNPKHSLSECNFKGRHNKIVIPFYWNNELIYFQVRNQPPLDIANRYFMPVINHKPIYASPFNKLDNRIGIFCEGVFGAIATSFKYEFQYNTYALQGSYLTDYQLWMIESLGLDKLILYFDDYDISLGIYKKLVERSKFLYEGTKIIKSEYHDPELDYLGNYIQDI